MEGAHIFSVKIVASAVLALTASSMVAGTAWAQAPVLASWYGGELAGNPTSSGEPFNPEGYTVASKTLPMHSLVEVCYKTCVKARVNDFGPHVGGREMDLSYAVARDTGLLGAGVDVVGVTLL